MIVTDMIVESESWEVWAWMRNEKTLNEVETQIAIRVPQSVSLSTHHMNEPT